MGRGVEPDLARQVARQLMAKDALGAHARDELGISEITTARPLQAALTSAATFAAGAAMPLLATLAAPAGMIIPVVTTASLITLAVLGAVGAKAGGASRRCGARRVLGRLRHGRDRRYRRPRRRTNLAAHRSFSVHACTELQHRRRI